jgi:hypothetical protein
LRQEALRQRFLIATTAGRVFQQPIHIRANPRDPRKKLSDRQYDKFHPRHASTENLDRIMRLILGNGEIEQEIGVNGYERGLRGHWNCRKSSSWHEHGGAAFPHLKESWHVPGISLQERLPCLGLLLVERACALP